MLGPDRTLASAFAAYAYPENRYGEVRARKEWQGIATYFDDACVAVVPASRDRGLRALSRLGDTGRRRKLLGRLIGRNSAMIHPEPLVLRYKPGRRLVLRLGGTQGPHASLKSTAQGEFTQSLIGATAAAAMGGAALLAASPEIHTLVTGWVAGVPLCPELAGRQPTLADLRATGAALARLHAAHFRPPHRITRSDEAKELIKAKGDLAVLAPTLAREVEDLVPRIVEALGPAPKATFIHGDFSADQVILQDGVPTIIDWDGAATGEPARDLGTFFARLDAQAIDGVMDMDAANAAQTALRDGYAELGDPRGETAQHARALVMLSSEGFRLRLPDWPERIAALLARARALLAQPTLRSRSDPQMPALATALDAHAMRPRLAQVLGFASEDVRLAAPVLLRHKKGRRALVGYHLELACNDSAGRQTLLGKLRAKGPDHHTPRVHAALRDAGLDGSAPHRVGVPAPRGQIGDLQLWLQETAPGRTVADFLQPDTDPAPFARVGAALARLHRLAPVTQRMWTLEDETRVLDTALRNAAARLPAHAATLEAIVLGARHVLGALGPGPVCGIHRDFYFDQALVDGDTVWLVDLDLYAIGDPAIDIGNFLAHLDEYALRLHDDPGALAAHGAAFVDGYRQVSDAPETGRIATLRAVSLARHIYLSTRLAERGQTTEPLLALSFTNLAVALETDIRAPNKTNC
jgi:Ser/Thr protein kinase RdoA (MazF antagonist)